MRTGVAASLIVIIVFGQGWMTSGPAVAECGSEADAELGDAFLTVGAGTDCDDTGEAGQSRYIILKKPFDGTENRSCIDDSSPDGAGYFQYRIDRETGEIVDVEIVCLRDTEPVPVADPVVLPSAAEVWDRVAIPQPQVHLNPRVRGLVGLETYLWYDQSTELTVDAGLPGIAVTATVRPVKFRWSFGNGDTVEAPGDRPGSDQDPAATYVFTEPCAPCQVTLTVTWGGSYTVTGVGAPITGDLGTRDIVSTRAYDVVEVQARIDHER